LFFDQTALGREGIMKRKKRLDSAGLGG
jgi:hypothetical protein